MIEKFPLLQQPPGSNSCLTTAVRAILLWNGLSPRDATVEAVSEWCREEPKGCWIDQAIEGLRAEGFEVEELAQGREDGIVAVVMEAEEPQPVLVTVQLPHAPDNMDHAVVVVEIEQEPSREVVAFMDPLTGQIERDVSERFWAYWDLAGGRAFVIRP